MDISLSGNAIGIVILAFIASIIAIIFILRAYLKNQAESSIEKGHKDRHYSSPLAARNKYPEVDPFRLSGPILRFGLAGALLLSVLAFSWTQYEKEIFIPEGALDYEEEIEIEPPRTAEPPPPPPPPPPPVIEEVPEEEIIEEEQPVFEDQSIDEETEIVEEPPEIAEEAPPPPTPPPPPPKTTSPQSCR